MKKTLLVIVCILILSGCKDVKLDNGEKAIVTFKEGGITAQELYETLKEKDGATKTIDLIDKYLLDKKYEETTEERNYINSTISSIEKQAEEYQVDLETYASYYYGVNTKDALKSVISLNYKREQWVKEYAKTTVTDKQIQEYYDTEVVGDMELSHILITSSAKSDDSEDKKNEAEQAAYKQAKEIITKLENKEDFNALAKEFSKDEATAKNGGSLGTVTDGSYSSEVYEAAKKMEVGSYSTTPVKSSYGYHIIYKTSQAEKKELNDELKKTITEKVGEEIASGEGFSAKALLALRDQNEIKFVDTELEKQYNKKVGK